MLLVLGLSFSRSWLDPYTGYRYDVDSCKAYWLTDAFESFADPDCMSESTYVQLEDVMAQLNNEGGILNQLSDTVRAADECSDGTVDQACIARYRSQFRSQQASFNSLMSTGTRLAVVAGREAIANECITRQEFSEFYMMYAYNIMMCSGGRTPPIITP
jgi:hypothetical protein